MLWSALIFLTKLDFPQNCYLMMHLLLDLVDFEAVFRFLGFSLLFVSWKWWHFEVSTSCGLKCVNLKRIFFIFHFPSYIYNFLLFFLQFSRDFLLFSSNFPMFPSIFHQFSLASPSIIIIFALFSLQMSCNVCFKLLSMFLPLVFLLFI